MELKYLDLPTLLYGAEGGSDLTLVGLLTGYINPPSSLASLTYKKGTKLGRLELIGVKVHIDKGNGEEDTIDYLCKGEVPVLVDEYYQEQYKTKPLGKLGITVRGNITLARGTKRGRLNTPDANLVVGFKRYVGEYNVWCARPYKMNLVSKVTDSVYFDLLLEASKNNWDLHGVTNVEIPRGYVSAGEGVNFTYTDGTTPIVPKIVTDKVISKDVIDTSKILGGSLGVVGKEVTNKLESNVVNSEDISVLLKNRVKEEIKIETRFKTVPKSGGIKELNKLIDKSTLKVNTLVDEIKGVPKSSWSDAIEYMAVGLSRVWAKVGKPLLLGTLIKLFPKEENKLILLESVLGSEFALKWGRGEVIEDYEGLCNLLHITAESVYVNIIDTVLKLGGNLVNTYYTCKDYELCLLSIMHRNPYYLGLIDVKLNIEDLDLLAILYNIEMTESVVRLRNAVLCHLYMLNSNNRGVDSNTLIKKGYLYFNLKGGKILNKTMYDLMCSTSKILTDDQIKTSQLLFAPTLKEELLIDSREGYVETYVAGTKKYLKSTKECKTLIDDYINSGLGIKTIQDGVEYICDYVLAEMEMYIYNKLYDLANVGVRKSKVDFNNIISEFEKRKSDEFGVDFKLEDMQKKVTELTKVNAGCLTGCAGSGKTTTAELLLYGLEKTTNLKREDVVFVAPTGKASARLREVVKRKASTIHSYFGVKGESYSIFDRLKDVEPIIASAIIADEMSMCNLHLMYTMLKRVTLNTRLYLIGDKEQLTPIGFGKPFVNALHYLPTILLDVNKRASNESGIMLNSETIVKTDISYKPLVSTDDFKLVNVDKESIEETILNICRYHLGIEDIIEGCEPVSNLGKITVDDIQVVTPVNKGEWGTRNLNKRLQMLFNPRARASVRNRKGYDSEVTFKIGDRVIHTENHADTIRLESLGNGTYKKLKDDLQNGVMNGDVGKVVDIQYGKDIHFIGSKELTEQYKGTDYTYYLVVEYKDIDTDTLEPIKYYILYGFEAATHTNHMDAKAKGNGLGVLDLAYALTVHKLQGSQAKLVIFALDKVGRKGFISRNMIYTGVTRSELACYLVGSIIGYGSAVDEGRRIQQCDYILTTLDKVI